MPASHNTAKEPPVVSAITDAAEVTITSKPKDRESPAKSRKTREPTRERELKEPAPREVAPLKEAPASDNPEVCNLQINSVVFVLVSDNFYML